MPKLKEEHLAMEIARKKALDAVKKMAKEQFRGELVKVNCELKESKKEDSGSEEEDCGSNLRSWRHSRGESDCDWGIKYFQVTPPLEGSMIL